MEIPDEEEEEDSSGIEHSSDSEEEERGAVTSQVKEFFSELNIEESKQKRRLFDEGFKIHRRKSVLPQHLHAVMGSANLRLARGDTYEAIELCKEVIRQAPQASEPYLTLATVYEELEDKGKLFQILLIAAHLKRTDQDLWLKCAALAKKQRNLPMTVKCLSKAISMEPKNVDLIWERASSYADMKEHKKAIESFELILKLLPESSGQKYVEITKELASLYHATGETAEAIKRLGELLVSHSQLVDPEIINILAELCITCQAYERVYDVITEFYDMVPQATEEADQGNSHLGPFSTSTCAAHMADLTTALRISISGENIELDSDFPLTGFDSQVERTLFVPDDMPVDLRVKLAVAMIHTGKEVTEKLLVSIFSSPEDFGDLFLDVSDAYTSNAEYTKALPLLTALVSTAKYSQAGVWLKHGECQHMLNDLEGAAMSYSKVLSLAPHHTDTRLQLATLYVQLGHADDALVVLESDPNPDRAEGELDSSKIDDTVGGAPGNDVEQEQGKMSEEIEDLRITIHKYKLFLSANKLQDYVKSGCSLLAFLFRDVYNHPSIKVMIKVKSKKRKAFRSVFASEGRKEEKEIENLFSAQEWFDLYRDTCKGLLKLDSASSNYKIIYFIYCAALTQKFYGGLEKPFLFFSVSLSFILQDYGTSFMLLRDLCYQEPENKHLWNIINLLPLDDINRKFVLRVCQKHSGAFIMRILANHSLTSASMNFHFCLNQYEKEFREGHCRDHLLSLCIAIVHINAASVVKNPPNKNGLITMASGFLHTYVTLRGECQESMYNMGRAFHQLEQFFTLATIVATLSLTGKFFTNQIPNILINVMFPNNSHEFRVHEVPHWTHIHTAIALAVLRLDVTTPFIAHDSFQSLVHIACNFYKKVLIMEPECKLPKWTSTSNLRSEAAFNLSLIYRASGNLVLARNLLRRYLFRLDALSFIRIPNEG